jgi:hypothetical protein
LIHPEISNLLNLMTQSYKGVNLSTIRKSKKTVLTSSKENSTPKQLLNVQRRSRLKSKRTGKNAKHVKAWSTMKTRTWIYLKPKYLQKRRVPKQKK